MVKISRLLVAVSVVLLAAAVAALVVCLVPGEKRKAFSVGDIKAMPPASGEYRSINNWSTVETTAFKGVPVEELLERSGAGAGATVKFIAPDGYFWPPVGEKLTAAQMARKNPAGLLPLIAYQTDRESLDPEPDGSGPLRYVAPQYSDDEVNKPGWVSNLRLVEVSPLPEGFEKPDAREVPENQVWFYGNVAPSHIIGWWIPALLGAAGAVVLPAGLVPPLRAKRKAGAAPGGAVAALLAILLAACAVGVGGARAESSFTFTMSDIQAMPPVTGHYTFLKQLPPYTYYEADYTGVTLEHLLQQRLNLAAGASGVVVRSRDGYVTTLSLEQALRTYPSNLKALIAYSKGGKEMKGDEGPFRLIVPQASPGTHDQGSDPNTPLCARMVTTIEVSPVPGGVAAPDPAAVPSGSLVVFGSVAAPPDPRPGQTPAAADQGTPAQPAPENPQVTQQPQATARPAAMDALVTALGGVRGVAMVAALPVLSVILPRPLFPALGLALWVGWGS